MSYPYKTLSQYSPHDLIIFTEFHEDREKNVEFLTNSQFLTVSHFFMIQTLHHSMLRILGRIASTFNDNFDSDVWDIFCMISIIKEDNIHHLSRIDNLV